MVAAVALENGAGALWARCGVIAQIGFGGEIFGRGLCVEGSADLKVAVPTLSADAAEGEDAATADLEFGWGWGFRGAGRGGRSDGSDGGGGGGNDGFGAVVAEVVRGVVVSHRGV